MSIALAFKTQMCILRVSTAGYRIGLARPQHQFLTLPTGENLIPSDPEVVVVPVDLSAPLREYDSDSTPLVSAFYDMPLTHEGVIDFANKFGLLSDYQWQDIGVPGEPLCLWAQEKQEIFNVIEAHESLRKAGRGFGAVFVDTNVRKRAHQLGGRTRERMLQEALALDLQARVSRKLGDYVRLGVKPRYESQRPGFVFDYEPRTTIGALWLQCAWLLTGDRDYRRCEYCNNYLASGFSLRAGARQSRKPKARRSHARFCKPACQAAKFQKDVALARALLTEHHSLDVIADRIGRSRDDVQKWMRTGVLRAYRRPPKRHLPK